MNATLGSARTALGLTPDAMRTAARSVSSSWGRVSAQRRMLPDFLICGAQRCGTTSLFRTLVQHPDVVPPFLHKGVHFFDTASRYARGPAWYRGHFPLRELANRRSPSGRAVTGEASPYYVFHPLAGERIARELPDARLIVLLRDPVARAYSSHKQETGRGFETEPLERALALEEERLAGEEERLRADPTYQSFSHQHHAYRRRGQYAEQLDVLCAAVGRDRVLVLETDDLFAPGSDAWAKTLDHLSLRRFDPGEMPRANARPSSPMPAHLRRDLEDHFAPHDARLAAYLGGEPSWRR